MTFIIDAYNSFVRGEITREAMIEMLKSQPWQYGRILGPGVSRYIPGDTDEFMQLFDKNLVTHAEAAEILSALPSVPEDVQQTGLSRKWEGEDAVMEYGTYAWLQIGDALVDVTLATKHWPAAAGNDCEGCVGTELLGARWPVDSTYGIERCDVCELYPGDLHAARAVAARIGEHVAVWYEPSLTETAFRS